MQKCAVKKDTAGQIGEPATFPVKSGALKKGAGAKIGRGELLQGAGDGGTLLYHAIRIFP